MVTFWIWSSLSGFLSKLEFFWMRLMDNTHYNNIVPSSHDPVIRMSHGDYDYNYSAHSLSGLFSRPITSSITLTCITYLRLFIFTTIVILLNCVYPNPPCQLSLWEETGAPGENPRLSAECWRTLFTRVHTWVPHESHMSPTWVHTWVPHESHESVARIGPTISEVKGGCSDDCATEAPTYYATQSGKLHLAQWAIP
jgi:hypothetical protein